MSSESPYKWLEPEMWRRLIGRAALFHAGRGPLARLCDLAEHSREIEGLLTDFGVQARNLCYDDGDDERAVREIAAAWDEKITDVLALRNLDDEARSLLLELQQLLPLAVVEDPFRRLLDNIGRQAENLYGPAWRPVSLSVRHCNSHPRGADDLRRDPYTVTARTPWPPDPAAAEVELEVYCDEFGPAAYAAVPMLLAHECVCHVPARQDRAKNSSTFAEGFLDWAAYYFFGRWAHQIDEGLATASKVHAQRLMQVLTGGPSSKEKQTRRRGHYAAEVLVTWFEQECRLPSDEAKKRVARLAVELNQVDKPLLVKEHFISRIGEPLPPPFADDLRAWVAGTLSSEGLLALSERQLA